MKRLIISAFAALAIGLVAAPVANAEWDEDFLLVPKDITPGTYFAQIKSGHDYGYFAVCGDYACDTDHGDLQHHP